MTPNPAPAPPSEIATRTPDGRLTAAVSYRRPARLFDGGLTLGIRL